MLVRSSYNMKLWLDFRIGYKRLSHHHTEVQMDVIDY